MREIVLLEPFRALFYAPFYLALAGGACARQGLSVRLETAESPDAAAERLLAGDAHLAWGGPMRIMRMRNRDPAPALRSFCGVVMRDPFLLMGAVPRPGFALADLAGLRLGLVAEVPTPVWCLDDDLRRAGIDPAAPDRRRGPSMAENARALIEGHLDVAQLFEPHACQVEDAGGAVWHAQAGRGPTAYTAFYATAAMLASEREAMRGMVRAMAETLAWLHGSTPEAVAETIAPFFPDVPPAHRLRAVARYRSLGVWTEATRLPRAAYDRLGEAMVSSGVMPSVPPFEACVEAAIVEEALGA